MFFIFFLRFVTIQSPLANNCSNKLWLMYPLSPYNRPNSFFVRSETGLRSSTLAAVSSKASSSPLSLTTKCSLKPKYHPVVDFERHAKPLNTRWELALLTWHTGIFVESMNDMPEHEDIIDFKKKERGNKVSGINSTKRFYDKRFGNSPRR